MTDSVINEELPVLNKDISKDSFLLARNVLYLENTQSESQGLIVDYIRRVKKIKMSYPLTSASANFRNICQMIGY
jgi:hypothetical protein